VLARINDHSSSAARGDARPPAILIGPIAGAQKVEVRIRGEHFTTYHYGDSRHVPFLWPVKAEGGVGVTRNYPMGSDEPSITDHPHHLSLYLTYGVLNGLDFWHKGRRNDGVIRTVELETGAGADYAWIRAHKHWIANDDGRVVMEEQRELRFHDSDASARVFDFISTFQATQGDVTFGDTKEGMIGFRMSPALDGDRGGVLTNADGLQRERAVYGKPSPWMDYTGELPGVGKRGVALFDHPDNTPRGHWHVRNYGLASLNPFGSRSISRQASGEHTLPQGEELTFQYRFLVHSGDHEEADVAGHYQRYTEMGRGQRALHQQR